MSREVIVKPLGLVTRPNLYGQYEVGALSQARNMVVRAPGILETAPATVLGLSFGASDDVVHQLFSLAAGKMFSVSRSSGGTWTPRIDTVACHQTVAIAAAWSQTGRIATAVVRERLVTNTADQGVKVIDLPTLTSPAELRDAGFSQPCMPLIQSFPTGQALKPNDCAGYAVAIRREYADGYVLLSKPSVIAVIRNDTAGTINVAFTLRFDATTPFGMDGTAVGDFIELYRTAIISQSTSSTDPGTTLNLISAVKITTALKTAGTVNLVDDTLPGPLGATTGRALYTNPGQEGLLGGNRIPSTCQALAVFKQYTFLGNITERPQLTFQVPAGISSTANSGYDTAAWRASGVGERVGASGTVTNGSATITAIAAADLVGVVAGQLVDAQGTGAFPANTVVNSVGATTIVASAVATAGGTGFRTRDVIAFANSTIGIPIYSSPRQFISQVYVSSALPIYEVSSSENFLGVTDPANGILAPTITIEPFRISQFFLTPFNVKATNGANYSPEVQDWSLGFLTIPAAGYKNLLRWSKDSQPEHFPVPNETFVGAGEIIALESTRDALWIFCTDGLFRLSGDGGSWRVDTMDTTLVLSAPRASCVLSEVVYAYTNRGFVRITDAGVESLSERIIGDLLPGVEYTETASIIVERNEAEDEIVIRVDATEPYVYSVRENAFTTLLVADVTAMTYVRYPVSGLATLAFGRSPSGSTPRYELWNSVANWLAGTTRFQPVFAGDPFSAKRWIDCSYIFSAASTGISVTCVWNGGPTTTTSTKNSGRYFNESRGVAAVPRNAATGNTLAPGFNVIANTVPARLYALSLRYAQNGEQQLKRT